VINEAVSTIVFVSTAHDQQQYYLLYTAALSHRRISLLFLFFALLFFSLLFVARSLGMAK